MTSASKFKFLFYYFFITLLLSLSYAFYFNPNHIVFNGLINSKIKHPKSNFFLIEPQSASKFYPVSQYRNDNKRTGYYHIDFDPLKMEKVILKTGSLNYGIHGASKSTPMSLGDYTVVATDVGSIKILKNNSLYWTISLNQSSFGYHSSPVLFDKNLIIGDYSGRLYYFNLDKKKLIWMIHLGNSVGATPFLEDHFLYVNIETKEPNGFIAKLDLIKNEIVWISDYIGNHSHSSVAIDENSIYFGDNNSKFQSLDKKTGEINFITYVQGPIKSTPALYKNSILITSWDGNLYSIDKNNGRINWTYRLKNGNQSSVAVDEKNNYAVVNAANGLHKIDLLNGQKLNHIDSKFYQDARKASPIILDYKSKPYIVSSCDDAKLCIYDSKNFNLLKEFVFTSGISNQPGVSNQGLYISTQENESLYFLKVSQ